MTATVYTADIVGAPGEAIVENNQRSVLVSPAVTQAPRSWP